MKKSVLIILLINILLTLNCFGAKLQKFIKSPSWEEALEKNAIVISEFSRAFGKYKPVSIIIEKIGEKTNKKDAPILVELEEGTYDVAGYYVKESGSKSKTKVDKKIEIKSGKVYLIKIKRDKENKTIDIVVDEISKKHAFGDRIYASIILSYRKLVKGEFVDTIDNWIVVNKKLTLDECLTDAYLYMLMGESKKADYLFTKAIELGANDHKIYFEAGRIKQRLEDYKAAIEFYSKAIKMDPENIPYLAHRESAKLKIGDKAGSLKDRAKVKELRDKKTAMIKNYKKTKDSAFEKYLLEELQSKDYARINYALKAMVKAKCYKQELLNEIPKIINKYLDEVINASKAVDTIAWCVKVIKKKKLKEHIPLLKKLQNPTLHKKIHTSVKYALETLE